MKTINLLPKPRQNELRYDATLRSILVILGMTLISYVVVFLVQFGLKFVLRLDADSIETQISQLKGQVGKKENAEVKAKVKAVNDSVTDFLTLSNLTPRWSKTIKAFLPLPPASVKINNFTIDPLKKSINITGEAPTREAVIELYNNILDDTENFNGINYPLENVAQPTENKFHFTFFIDEKLLK